jgi:hypothetical protein
MQQAMTPGDAAVTKVFSNEAPAADSARSKAAHSSLTAEQSS